MELEKRYFNIHEVAAYLGVSRFTVYRLIDRRKIPFIPLTSKSYRFDRLRIDKWMERKEVKVPPEAA